MAAEIAARTAAVSGAAALVDDPLCEQTAIMIARMTIRFRKTATKPLSHSSFGERANGPAQSEPNRLARRIRIEAEAHASG